MLEDVDAPESDAWWLTRLHNKLTHPERVKRLSLLDNWYEGKPPMPSMSPEQQQIVWQMIKLARSNFAELIVEASRERLKPVGFTTAADDDATGDSEAWRWWRAAELEVEQAEVHRTALRLGDAYVITGPPDPDDPDKVPVVTSEDPRQVVTEHDPRKQSRVRAAAKFYRDDILGMELAYLWKPGMLRVASRKLLPGSIMGMERQVSFNAKTFDWDTELSMTLPENMMPVTRFRNARGKAEFEGHLDLLERINHQVLQRVTIAVFQAFKQRAAMNLPERDPETGEKIDYDTILRADPAAFWRMPEGVEFWESGAVDLTPVISAVRADVEMVAAVTRTPMHYMSPGTENQSAEGAALAKEGLVFKCEDRQTRFGAGWRQVVHNMALWKKDTERAKLIGLEVKWAAADRPSLAERMSAASQAVSAGVPWRTRMQIAGFSPPEIDRMEAERADDQLLMAQQAAAGMPGQPGAVPPSLAQNADRARQGMPTTGSAGGTRPVAGGAAAKAPAAKAPAAKVS